MLRLHHRGQGLGRAPRIGQFKPYVHQVCASDYGEISSQNLLLSNIICILSVCMSPQAAFTFRPVPQM